MNKTNNYQLNQWEKTDRILMDDFNRDNAEIDAALKAETDRLAEMPHGILLCGGTTEVNAERVDLDVSQVDWSRWLFAALELRMPTVAQMRFYINGAPSGSCAHGYLGSTAYSTGELGFFRAKDNSSLVLMPVLYSGAHPFQAFNLNTQATFGFCSAGLNSVSKFTLVVYATQEVPTIPAGTTFRLWGVR